MTGTGYIERLRLILLEYQATQAAIAYAEQNRERLSGKGALYGVSREDLGRALRSVEFTFVVRLFTEFDAILREYLLIHHPQRAAWHRAKAMAVVDRVARLEGIKDELRDGVHEVREYRNSLVHPGGLVATTIKLEPALAALSKFLARLPDGP